MNYNPLIVVDNHPLPIPELKDEVNFGTVRYEYICYMWVPENQRWVRFLPPDALSLRIEQLENRVKDLEDGQRTQNP